jgi:glycosyltransferase involved in cell wall biosynthesis
MQISPLKILVIGQTPPPYGGQAMMIKLMLDGQYEKIKLFHVRMAFSKEMDEIGKLKISKVFHLFEVILKVLYAKVKHRPDVLYYPPTGPNKIPFVRDSIILIALRPFFKKTCLHFHASGISEMYPILPSFFKAIFKKAYFGADLGLKLSYSSPEDPKLLEAKRECIVPNGVEDHFSLFQSVKPTHSICRILFVGLLCEAKGLLTTLEACSILKQNKIEFHLDCVGKFESKEFEARVKSYIEERQLNTSVKFHGVLVGHQKHEVFFNSDVFCFPSFFEAENFPVVLLEALQFCLPVVTTNWRGIPSLIEEDSTGFLVKIKKPDEVAAKLECLICNEDLRLKMGMNARRAYLKSFTIETFYENIEAALSSI